MTSMLQTAFKSLLVVAAAAEESASTDIDAAYRQAVRDAAFAEQDELAAGLIRISPDNPDLIFSEDGERLLVATWKAKGSYERFLAPYDKTSENPDYGVWVTNVPQVQRFCREFVA